MELIIFWKTSDQILHGFEQNCNIFICDNVKYWTTQIIITQVGFAELKKTADNRANISGTIIGAPIVGQ